MWVISIQSIKSNDKALHSWAWSVHSARFPSTITSFSRASSQGSPDAARTNLLSPAVLLYLSDTREPLGINWRSHVWYRHSEIAPPGLGDAWDEYFNAHWYDANSRLHIMYAWRGRVAYMTLSPRRKQLIFQDRYSSTWKFLELDALSRLVGVFLDLVIYIFRGYHSFEFWLMIMSVSCGWQNHVMLSCSVCECSTLQPSKRCVYHSLSLGEDSTFTFWWSQPRQCCLRACFLLSSPSPCNI